MLYSMMPYRSHHNLPQEKRVPSLFDDRFFRSFFDMNDWMGNNMGFRVDIHDDGDHYTLEAELPGVSEDQIIINSKGSDVPYHYNGKHQLNKDRRVEIIPEFQYSETVDENTDLREMADYYYGDEDLWVFIYAANRDQLDDPDNLPIGAELRIPNLADQFEDMTDKQINDAIKQVKKRQGLR